MKFGNCVGFKDTKSLQSLKDLGFDYVETAFWNLSNATDEEISIYIKTLDKIGIPCEVVNVLFPKNIILVGENVSYKNISKYLEKAFEKTAKIGYKTVVFGSGASRRFPENFPKDNAVKQIIFLAKNILCEFADKYNLTIALETLNKKETNCINTLNEAIHIIDEINLQRFKLLVDFYHTTAENDDLSILENYPNIAHCHVATPNIRQYPTEMESDETKNDFKMLFSVFKKANYDERISIEAGLGVISGDFQEESRLSLQFLKSKIAEINQL